MAVKNSLEPLWKDIPLKGYLYFSLFLNVLSVVSVLVAKNFLPPVAPLLYGRPEGEGQLVPTLWLLSAPLTSFVITLINILLVRLVKDAFMQKILVMSAFLLSILTTITIVKIVFLVGLF